jgi:hypothetical protein
MLKRQRQSKLPLKFTASKSINDSEYFWRIYCNCNNVIHSLEASKCWTRNCNYDSCSECGRVEKKARKEVLGDSLYIQPSKQEPCAVLRVGDVSPLKVEVRDSPVRVQGMSAVLDYEYVNAQENDFAEPRGYDYSASHRGAYSSTAQPTYSISKQQSKVLTDSIIPDPTLDRLGNKPLFMWICCNCTAKVPKNEVCKSCEHKSCSQFGPDDEKVLEGMPGDGFDLEWWNKEADISSLESESEEPPVVTDRVSTPYDYTNTASFAHTDPTSYTDSYPIFYSDPKHTSHLHSNPNSCSRPDPKTSAYPIPQGKSRDASRRSCCVVM